MTTEHESLLSRLQTEFPKESKYRVSIETSDSMEVKWFISVEPAVSGPSIFGWGGSFDAALAMAHSNYAERPTLEQRKAERVATLEAEIAKLQGEVTKTKEVAA